VLRRNVASRVGELQLTMPDMQLRDAIKETSRHFVRDYRTTIFRIPMLVIGKSVVVTSKARGKKMTSGQMQVGAAEVCQVIYT
jgi:hypothetical protein